jgi:hypothetical protein
MRDQLMNEIKTAMKDKNSEKVNALRLLQSAIKNREIELRPNAINEEECLGVVRKLVKQRKESIEQYQAANRKDLADAEAAELKILETYLPAQMGREQIEAIIGEEIGKLGAKTIKEMGAVMKAVQARTAGAADNKLVSEIIKSKLN